MNYRSSKIDNFDFEEFIKLLKIVDYHPNIYTDYSFHEAIQIVDPHCDVSIKEVENTLLELGYNKQDTPIHKNTDGWWFWDETWADRHGPFSTSIIANEELRKYCKELG